MMISLAVNFKLFAQKIGGLERLPNIRFSGQAWLNFPQ